MKTVGVEEITGIWPLLKSIDWFSETWLQVLIAFHILCTSMIYLGRNNVGCQVFLFLVLLLTVRLSEYINEWAATNYKLFATEQYFDSNGLFISTIFSVPALFNCFFIVMNWIADTGTLLGKVKRAKYRHESRQTRTEPDTQEVTSEAEVQDGNKKDN
ncbi:transmembrane protein 18-like [Lineus longissimus]|uniref:transmembrane protein 18-like n=1 Tax=Lineus longissimus TaxID=88925 RepID=UPI002B4EAD0F